MLEALGEVQSWQMYSQSVCKWLTPDPKGEKCAPAKALWQVVIICNRCYIGYTMIWGICLPRQHISTCENSKKIPGIYFFSLFSRGIYNIFKRTASFKIKPHLTFF